MLEELKKNWVSHTQADVQARIWDRAAADYGKKPLPDMQQNPFLKALSEAVSLTEQTRVLDVGCGAGGYSLALAPFVGEAVGVDISGGMIDAAKERCRELEIQNARFDCLNWNDADIDKLHFRGRFQVVFAHMTPAICDYDTLEKMDACSSHLCMLEKSTRRRDMVLDEALGCVGIDSSGSCDSDLIHIFTYLWCKGYSPRFSYKKEVWDSERSTADMIGWCTDRARLQKELTEAEEETIAAFVEGLAQDGRVKEHTTTTRVTIIWKKE